MEAYKLIYELASTLDKQQRLILQNQKTKIYSKEAFIEVCNDSLVKKPINDIEGQMIQIFKDYTSGGYESHLTVEIPKEKLDFFTEVNIKFVLDKYLNEDHPNFSRIRWIFRKLALIGTPNAINYINVNINKLFPALNDICKYFISIANKQSRMMYDVGDDLFKLLNHQVIQVNDYCLISVLSLFSNTNKFNHIQKILSLYRSSSEIVKRKIILAAFEANEVDWIRELKEDYPRMDVWTKRALLISMSKFPIDERKFYLNGIKQRLSTNDILERILIEASNSYVST